MKRLQQRQTHCHFYAPSISVSRSSLKAIVQGHHSRSSLKVNVQGHVPGHRSRSVSGTPRRLLSSLSRPPHAVADSLGSSRQVALPRAEHEGPEAEPAAAAAHPVAPVRVAEKLGPVTEGLRVQSRALDHRRAPRLGGGQDGGQQQQQQAKGSRHLLGRSLTAGDRRSAFKTARLRG